MAILQKIIVGVQIRLAPFYRAWVATLSALIFGLGPILCTWITFELRGSFHQNYTSTLEGGDALMVASALVGPALILAFKKRDPETMVAPQLVGLLGIVLFVICVIVFMDASPSSALAGGAFNKHRVLICTYVMLPVCTCYALWISYLDERSYSMQEFNRRLDSNGKELTISVPDGGGK